MKPLLSRVPVLLPLLCAAACHGAARSRPPLVQPGAPGEASRVIASSETPAPSASRVSDADVRFMQGMIGHHAQAIEMTALLASRSTNPDLRLLAQRIEVSQADEIAMMQAWLKAHGRDVPGQHAHHAHGATLMPGMLTAEEMGKLAAARGAEFDRLFLQYMIRHHDGALIMVKDLFAQPGAAQDSEMFAFASDVDADQRMEIVRMSGMLKELVK